MKLSEVCETRIKKKKALLIDFLTEKRTCYVTKIESNSLASQLSYSFAGGSSRQNFTINGTNYLTTITLTGGGSEVVVQTTIPAPGTTAFFR